MKGNIISNIYESEHVYEKAPVYGSLTYLERLKRIKPFAYQIDFLAFAIAFRLTIFQFAAINTNKPKFGSISCL